MNPIEPPPDDPPVRDQSGALETVESQPSGQIARVIRQAVRSELRLFAGPLPPPDLLKEYNEAFPGCAERIVAMAEKEQQHRHETSKQETSAEILLARRGQLIGAALAAIVLLGGIYLVANDKSIQRVRPDCWRRRNIRRSLRL